MKQALAPGTPLPDARRRMVGRGFWLDSPTADGVDTSTSTRAIATCTASATPHTKGSWTQIIAATTVDATMLSLAVGSSNAYSNAIGANTVNSSTLLDIGIGGAGSEVALVSNLGVGFSVAGRLYEIPVRIPAGSRVSICAQSAVVSQQVSVGLRLSTLPFGRQAPNHLVTIGADTSTSRGISLTTPGSANAKTAWTELTASTTEPFGALVIAVQGAGDATQGTSPYSLLDIGLGPAGSEVVRLADLFTATTSTEQIAVMFDPLLPIDIPLGSRIAARWQSANVGNSLDVILIGVPRQ